MYYSKHIAIVQIKFFKANPGKFHLMILVDKTCYEHILKINLTCNQFSADVTLLGVIIGKSLSFKKQIQNLDCKTQYNFHPLQRIRKCLTVEKTKALSNAFIDSQFNYALLIQMFCRKAFYYKLEKTHHKITATFYYAAMTSFWCFYC